MDASRYSNITREADQPPTYEKFSASYVTSQSTAFQPVNQPPPIPTMSANFQYSRNPNGVFVQPLPISSVSIYGVHPGVANINDYMAWSILNMLCCGLIFGIIGFILSSQVQQRKMAGDVQGAQSLSTTTAIWNAFTTLAGIGIIIGVCVYLANLGYL